MHQFEEKKQNKTGVHQNSIYLMQTHLKMTHLYLQCMQKDIE